LKEVGVTGIDGRLQSSDELRPSFGSDRRHATEIAKFSANTDERNLDERWALDGVERPAMALDWRGGSSRRLRRGAEAILRERDSRALRN
jgi:ATP-dependent Lon protease